MSASIHFTRIPTSNTAAYRASEYIHEHGPQTSADLFIAVHFGNKKNNRIAVLERSIGAGWLIERGDLIDICKLARDHFDGIEKKSAPIGTPAARREYNVYTVPPLSKKYIVNSRGFRDDAPAWSERAGQHFFTQA